MSSVFILIAAATLGIDVGWEPLSDGGHEYTIQMEPQLLDVLKEGKDEIFSEVPPGINIRRYRLLVGTGKLARVSGRQPRAEDADLAEKQPDQPPVIPRRDAKTDWPGKARVGESESEIPDAPRLGRTEPGAKPDPARPGRLQTADESPNLLEKATYATPSEAVQAKKPPSGPGVSGSEGEPSRPWFAFVTAMVFLCCSLGANIYLGWAAWDARSRYRSTLARLRTDGAS